VVSPKLPGRFLLQSFALRSAVLAAIFLIGVGEFKQSVAMFAVTPDKGLHDASGSGDTTLDLLSSYYAPFG
jgi:hypothetical protein